MSSLKLSGVYKHDEVNKTGTNGVASHVPSHTTPSTSGSITAKFPHTS